MNIYSYQFVVQCPENGESIVYRLQIQSTNKVLVEHIKAACALHREGHHEDVADSLFASFGGHQVIEAHHHGVDIRTERGG